MIQRIQTLTVTNHTPTYRRDQRRGAEEGKETEVVQKINRTHKDGRTSLNFAINMAKTISKTKTTIGEIRTNNGMTNWTIGHEKYAQIRDRDSIEELNGIINPRIGANIHEHQPETANTCHLETEIDARKDK